MVGPAEEFLASPSRFVHAHIVNALAQGARDPASLDADAVAAFEPYLASDALRGTIPCINDLDSSSIQRIPSGSLVRYVGMVRDMMNPEFYTGAYALPSGEWRTTKYDEFSNADIGSAVPGSMQTWERKVFFCVAVPGESPWVSEKGARGTPPSVAPPSQAPVAPSRDGAKRPREGDASMDVSSDGDASKEARMEVEAAPCSACNASATPPPGPSPSELVNAGDSPCFVKTYDHAGLEGLRLNDVVEVLGVISTDPRLAVFASPSAAAAPSGCACCPCDGPSHSPWAGEPVSEEDQARSPPASKVPRVHALCGRRIASCRNHAAAILAGRGANPPTPRTSRPTSDLASRAYSCEGVAQARAQALALLSGALCGDALAAEYALLQLFAGAEKSNFPDAGAPPHALVLPALNLCLPTSMEDPAASSVAAGVATVARSLLPRAVPLPALTIASLSASPMWPRKCHVTDRVIAGPLMVADDTLLVADETAMGCGSMGAIGARNIAALRGLLDHQRLEIDLGFGGTVPVPVNAPCVVLSKGRSVFAQPGPGNSLLEVRVCAGAAAAQPQTVHQGERAGEGVGEGVGVGGLDGVRAYLAAAGGQGPFEISAEVQAHLTEDFCARRQKGDVTAEAFSQELWLARLMCRSHGERELSIGRWRALRAMEEARVTR